MHKLTLNLVATFAILSMGGVNASAQRLSAAGKCEAAKIQEAGKYTSCLSKANAKLLKSKGECSLVSSSTVCYRAAECRRGATCVKDLTKYGTAVGSV